MEVANIGLVAQMAWLQFLAGSDVVQSRTVGTGLAAVTGLSSNADNGIVVDRGALRDHDVVRSLVDFMGAEQVPASLILSEPARPDEISFLLELGLTPENSANEMYLAVDDWPAALASGSVDIVEVADRESLREGLGVLGDGWFDEKKRERYSRVYESLGFGPGNRLRHWVAYRGDRVVAMATSFLFERAVMLMHCGVLASERRRGIGTALTVARLHAAHDDGAAMAVLSPSPDGYLLHRSLGFELKPIPHNRWFYLSP